MKKESGISTAIVIALIACVAAIVIAGIGAWVYIEKQKIDQEKTVSKSEIETEKTGVSFEKKQECESYRASVEEELGKMSDNPVIAANQIETLEYLFYSPKENSCLYATHRLTIAGEETGNREFFIYNVLTKSRVTSFQFDTQFEDYKKFVLDYSGGEIRL